MKAEKFIFNKPFLGVAKQEFFFYNSDKEVKRMKNKNVFSHDDIRNVVFEALQHYGEDKVVDAVKLSKKIKGVDFKFYIDCYINATDNQTLIMPEFIDSYIGKENITIEKMTLGEFYDEIAKNKFHYGIQ